MKLLIPSAKEMTNAIQPVEQGILSNETKAILEVLSGFTQEELARLYKMKQEMVQKEYERIQKLTHQTAHYYPAIDLFNGLMYRSMHRDSWHQKEKTYIKQHLFITSALYGVINAYDAIAHHRLDFQNKLMIQGKSLKQFWEQSFDLAIADESLLVSFLSSEFETVFSTEQQERMVKVIFQEEKQGCLKTHSTISKKARGAFVSAMATQQVQSIEKMKQLKVDGFVYQGTLSNPNQLVFVKKVD